MNALSKQKIIPKVDSPPRQVKDLTNMVIHRYFQTRQSLDNTAPIHPHSTLLSGEVMQLSEANEILYPKSNVSLYFQCLSQSNPICYLFFLFSFMKQSLPSYPFFFFSSRHGAISFISRKHNQSEGPMKHSREMNSNDAIQVSGPSSFKHRHPASPSAWAPNFQGLFFLLEKA